jgi:heptosyltransferase-1
LRVSDAERKWAQEFLSSQGVPAGTTVVGIHPGASVDDRRWPLDRFREVAQWLTGRRGVRILVFPERNGYGASLGEIGGVVIADADLRQLIALIERCSLLVGNNSGPMHIAGGLGVPTVVASASDNADWFSPLGEGHQLIKAADSQRSLDRKARRPPVPYGVAEISAGRMIEAVERALS